MEDYETQNTEEVHTDIVDMFEQVDIIDDAPQKYDMKAERVMVSEEISELFQEQ